MGTKFASVDDYVESFADETRDALGEVRDVIRNAAPEADERVSYGMACYRVDGKPLLYFAGWKKHLGLYPVPRGDAAFERDVAPYRRARDTVGFPLRDPMPLDLVDRIVRMLLTRSSVATADARRGAGAGSGASRR